MFSRAERTRTPFFLSFDGTVVAVSSETVQLINENPLESVLLTVLDHPLEICTVVGRTALGPVDLFSDDSVLMCLIVFIADFQLTFNGLLCLRVTGEKVPLYRYAFHM